MLRISLLRDEYRVVGSPRRFVNMLMLDFAYVFVGVVDLALMSKVIDGEIVSKPFNFSNFAPHCGA
mgnify:CR=1 FL=1